MGGQAGGQLNTVSLLTLGILSEKFTWWLDACMVPVVVHVVLVFVCSVGDI